MCKLLFGSKSYFGNDNLVCYHVISNDNKPRHYNTIPMVFVGKKCELCNEKGDNAVRYFFDKECCKSNFINENLNDDKLHHYCSNHFFDVSMNIFEKHSKEELIYPNWHGNYGTIS